MLPVVGGVASIHSLLVEEGGVRREAQHPWALW
jgi:hypothetical protein